MARSTEEASDSCDLQRAAASSTASAKRSTPTETDDFHSMLLGRISVAALGDPPKLMLGDVKRGCFGCRRLERNSAGKLHSGTK